jgi:hypothetical protein
MRRAVRLASLAGFWVLAASCAVGQDRTSPPSAPVAFSCTMTVGPLRGALGSGPKVPYSAVQESSRVQTLADGTIISSKPTSTKIYRDAQGRSRTEHPFCRQHEDDAGTWIEIRDPVSGYAYILDPASQKAYRYTVTAKQPSAPATASTGGLGTLEVGTPPQIPGTPAGRNSESLGSQTMEGVAADGVRTTTVVPVGEMGNDRPFNIVHETWTSPRLHVVVLSKTMDPRFGESTMRLTNIDLSEPELSFFEPPADYSVTDETEAVQLTFRRPSAPEK